MALDGGSALLLPTTASEHPISKRIRRVRAKNHLGSRASGMQGSLDAGTAWPYCRPESDEPVVERREKTGLGVPEGPELTSQVK